MEKSERWLADADIIVDYRNMRIEFTNKESIFSKNFLKATLKISLLLSTMLCILLIFVSLTSDSPAAAFLLTSWIPAFYLVCLFGLFIFYYACALIFQSFHFRNLYYRIKCRRARRTTIIPNPSGCIKMILKSSEPLIDLEYDAEVRKALKIVMLTKVKAGRFRREMHLNITLEGNPQGELVIKEY